MICDLNDCDIHIEDGDFLSDDWLREAVFGDENSVESCSQELAGAFLQKCDEYGLDYDQSSHPAEFAVMVQESAEKFILLWRSRLHAIYPAMQPGKRLPPRECQLA